MSDPKIFVKVADPSGSSVDTSSGATCQLTKPGNVVINTKENSTYFSAEGGVIIGETDQTTGVNKTGYLNKEGSIGFVKDAPVQNFIDEWNPVTNAIGIGLMVSGSKIDIIPSERARNYKQALTDVGIECREKGQEVSPVLNQSDVSAMAMAARKRTVSIEP